MQTNHPKVSLIEFFPSITDPRVNRTKDHDLIDILIIAICCLLCGGEGFNDMEDFGHAKHDWFKTFLRLRNGLLFRSQGPAGWVERMKGWPMTARCMASQRLRPCLRQVLK